MVSTSHGHSFLVDSLPTDLRPGATNEPFPVMEWSHIPELVEAGFSTVGVAINIFCGESIILAQHQKTEKLPQGGLGPIAETLKYKGVRLESFDGAFGRAIEEETGGVKSADLNAFINSREEWLPYIFPLGNHRKALAVSRSLHLSERGAATLMRDFQPNQEVAALKRVPFELVLSEEFTQSHTFRPGAKGLLAEIAFRESYMAPSEDDRIAVAQDESPGLSAGKDLDFDRIKGIWLRKTLSSCLKLAAALSQ